MNWSVEEKRIILYCFAYSRHKGWGKTKGNVFMDQLELSNLCKDKIQDTNVKNLGSLMSQIENHIPKCECDEIRARGLAKAYSKLSLYSLKRWLA